MLRLAVLFAVFTVVCMAVAFGTRGCAQKPAEAPVLPPAQVEEAPVATSKVTLLWVSPEGVKLYKITGPDAIVPAYVAIHPKGSVSVR